MTTKDELFHEWADKLQNIYDNQTAGDYTFLGYLGAFAKAYDDFNVAGDPTRHCFREDNCSEHPDHRGRDCCCCGIGAEAHCGCDCVVSDEMDEQEVTVVEAGYIRDGVKYTIPLTKEGRFLSEGE